MIQLHFAGDGKRKLECVARVAVEALGQPARVVADVSGLDPGPVVTNVPLDRRSAVVVDGARLLRFFSRLSLETESSIGRYDVHNRLSAATFSGREDSLNAFVAELRAHAAVAPLLASPGLRPTVVLSHDVDRVSNREPLALAGKLLFLAGPLLRLNRREAGQRLKSLALALSGRNTYWNFDEFARMESRYGFRSTFFFMAGRRGFKGARYALSSVRDVTRDLISGGWEVGLHVNYHGFDNLASIVAQKRALEAVTGQPVWGARFHWLRFDPKASFDLLIRAGFKYDSTLGFHDGIGHRTGVASAYLQPDAEGNALPIVEIPMTIMDIALLSYMGLTPDQAWQRISETLDAFKGTNATLSILWHSNVLADPVFEGWGDLYAKILGYLSDNGFVVKTGRQVCEQKLATGGSGA